MPLLSHGCDLTLGEHPFDTNSTIFFLRELWGEQGDFYAESKLSYRFTVLWCFLATMKYMSEGQWNPGLLLCTFFHEFPGKVRLPISQRRSEKCVMTTKGKKQSRTLGNDPPWEKDFGDHTGSITVSCTNLCDFFSDLSHKCFIFVSCTLLVSL